MGSIVSTEEQKSFLPIYSNEGYESIETYPRWFLNKLYKVPIFSEDK